MNWKTYFNNNFSRKNMSKTVEGREFHNKLINNASLLSGFFSWNKKKNLWRNLKKHKIIYNICCPRPHMSFAFLGSYGWMMLPPSPTWFGLSSLTPYLPHASPTSPSVLPVSPASGPGCSLSSLLRTFCPQIFAWLTPSFLSLTRPSLTLPSRTNNSLHSIFSMQASLQSTQHIWL